MVIENLVYMVPTKFRFIWASSFRGEDLKKYDPSETTIAYGGHNFSELRQIEQSLFYRGHSIHAAYPVSFIW
jgi:hypothetical protein